MKFEPVIGLEVHVQLLTRSKLFCSCPSGAFQSSPNSNICPVCTGQPGVLPVLNEKAVELAVSAALALNCRIREGSVFARKNYFYPDLPKNYQISQYEEPLSEKGSLELDGRKIEITRIHMEEDAGKLLHSIGSEKLSYSLVDFNRSSVPLIEIVSEPQIASAEEAYSYLTALKAILQYVGVSNCDMEKGEMRCDANISLRPVGSEKLGAKVEIKNLNSFKSVKEALEYEIKRQGECLQRGERIVQETRLWNVEKGQTETMRSKEEAHDYRYFPDPDLVPLELDPAWVQSLKEKLPELPAQRRRRLVEEFGLLDYDAAVVTSDRNLADYTEEALGAVSKASSKLVCNWVLSELLGKLNAVKKTISESPIAPKHIAELVSLIDKGTLSSKMAKEVFQSMWETGAAASKIVQEMGLSQVSDENSIREWVQAAVSENQRAVEDLRKGNERAIGAIVGAVMKKSQGKANPAMVNKLIKEILNEKV